MTTAIAFPRTASLALATEGDRPLARFISQDQLVEMLSDLRTASIVTIEAKTEPRLLAKHPTTGQPNPFKGMAVKVSHVNGIVNWSYANAVNNQRAREDLSPDFQPLPRHWGNRISGSPLVEHEGSLYLEMKVERSLSHRYETTDGQPLDTAAVEAYLPQRRPGRQGVEREVILRDYALASIVSIKMAGTVYFIRSAAEVAESSTTPIRIPA